MNDERETAELLGQLKISPSAEARERAFAKLQQEFAANTAAQPPPRRRLPLRFGIAAGFTVLAVAAWWSLSRQGPIVANVERVQGRVVVQGAALLSGAESAVSGATLHADDGIEVTGGSGLLIRYLPDLTVRLASGARAELTSREELRLTAGIAYVDATPGANAPLRVVTPHGVVTHVGTQYLVEAAADRLEVSVREGSAQVVTDGDASLAEAGHWVVHRQGAAPTRGQIAADDSRFDWIGALPTEFRLEGATLAEFMTWFHRETGLTPIYSTGVNAQDFADVKLKGSIEHLAPLDALSYVLATADLAWHREGKQVFIEKRVAGR
jgi:ferric-dicitrate binding protein FerR (iron transport regulator)